MARDPVLAANVGTNGVYYFVYNEDGTGRSIVPTMRMVPDTHGFRYSLSQDQRSLSEEYDDGSRDLCARLD